MNERIRELAKQAFGSTLDTDPILVFEAEKFAELLIQECARKVEDMIDNGWYADTGELKKHFGVEYEN
jgi:hypothetical protein